MQSVPTVKNIHIFTKIKIEIKLREGYVFYPAVIKIYAFSPHKGIKVKMRAILLIKFFRGSRFAAELATAIQPQNRARYVLNRPLPESTKSARKQNAAIDVYFWYVENAIMVMGDIKCLLVCRCQNAHISPTSFA